MMARVRYTRKRRNSRRGAAVAELAVCLPIVLLLVVGTLEACTMIFLNHSLAIASYEGVRVAINYDGTTSDVVVRCTEIIDGRDVSSGVISINPPDVASVPRGQPIAVTVSAPSDANALIPPWFFGGKTISATTTMVKE